MKNIKEVLGSMKMSEREKKLLFGGLLAGVVITKVCSKVNKVRKALVEYDKKENDDQHVYADDVIIQANDNKDMED